MKQSITKRLARLALLPALALAACDRSPTDTNGHELLLGQVIILDRSTVPHTPLAAWTHDAGWDSAELVQISHSAEDHRTRISVGAQMFTRGGQPITLSETGEFSVRYGVSSDPAGVVNMEFDDETLFHGDHVYLYGHNDTRTTGSAQIVFALWHIDHADAQTDPIQVTFVD